MVKRKWRTKLDQQQAWMSPLRPLTTRVLLRFVQNEIACGSGNYKLGVESVTMMSVRAGCEMRLSVLSGFRHFKTKW
jgi:hypothetical protein